MPKFKSNVKSATCSEKEGLVFYYSNHCPFMEPWIHRISKYSENKGFKTKAIEILNKTEAQNAPSPFSTCSIFYNGRFLTHELAVESKFDKYLETLKNKRN